MLRKLDAKFLRRIARRTIEVTAILLMKNKGRKAANLILLRLFHFQKDRKLPDDRKNILKLWCHFLNPLATSKNHLIASQDL
jgi:hypothetical protein